MSCVPRIAWGVFAMVRAIRAIVPLPQCFTSRYRRREVFPGEGLTAKREDTQCAST
jgi:hypothetical protein